MVGGSFANVRDFVVKFANVSGVNADGPAPRLNRGEDVLGLEVNVGNNWNSGLLGDDLKCSRVLVRRASDADDIAARRRELSDLLERGTDVVRLRRCHRLH